MSRENKYEDKAQKITGKYINSIINILNSIESEELEILQKGFDLSEGGSRAYFINNVLSAVLACAMMSGMQKELREDFLAVFWSFTRSRVKEIEENESLQTQH